MLDRESVEEFLAQELEDMGVEIPPHIPRDALVEAFCRYVEDDCADWLRESFMAFFNDGEPDWDWVKDQIGTDEEY